MSDRRPGPGGPVYRQLFDAQVLLSRSLLAGRRDTRTRCLSSEDNTACSTSSDLSSRRPGDHGDDRDIEDDDVSRLPDSVVADQLSSDVIKRLHEKKHQKHEETLKQLEAQLGHLSQVCETQVRTLSQELLSSLQEVDIRLDKLKIRMDNLEHVSQQDGRGIWEEVQEEVKLKKIKVMELNIKLTECERQRRDEIRAALRMNLHLLEEINLLPPPDVHRLIHTEATLLNQSLLANHRSTVRLLLLLQEDILQQESLLRRLWEDGLSRWRRSRVSHILDRFRCVCAGDQDQLISGQIPADLNEQRRDLIYNICNLAPPTCSTTLVSDWFDQLTAVNQRIDSAHSVLIHCLRCRYEETWRDRLVEVQSAQEALSALQLSEEEVKEVVVSQLLPLIGRHQSQDEERLAAVDVSCDAVARLSVHFSRCAFVVMRAAALLWETHVLRLKRREEDVQRCVDDLRRSQQQQLQRKKLRVDELLGGLRQESSEDALRTSLDKTTRYLQDIKDSCRHCVSAQCQLLDRLPSVFMEELVSYSSRLSSFFHVVPVYRPSPEEQNLPLSSGLDHGGSGCVEDSGEQRTGEDSAHPSQDWLTEAETSLLQFCDLSSSVSFTSSGGVAYTGPAFRCSAPDLQDPHQEVNLSPFPVELLTHTLARTRTLFFDHLEQHFQGVLVSAVATVMDRKEAVRLEQEVQLQQLNPDHVQTHVYRPRLAELRLHQQQVALHCEDVQDVLDSCRDEVQRLQDSMTRRNQDFSSMLSHMEDEARAVHNSQGLEDLRSVLQDHLDLHIKETQRSQTSLRRTILTRLEGTRTRTTQLLDSFRLFSEGGDFCPQEVRTFQRTLKDKTKQISGTEESVLSEMDTFESRSLQQVTETSSRFQEKLFFLQSELKFIEKTQRLMKTTRTQIQGQVASSNQDQSLISSRLFDLRKMMEDTQVSPDHVCCVLSSVHEDLRKRCQYLDLQRESLHLCPHPQSTKQRGPAPHPGVLQPSRTGVDLLEDPVMDVIRSLNRAGLVQTSDSVHRDNSGRSLLVSESVSAPSVRRSCRSGRTNKRFQMFGPKPEPSPHSFSSTINTILWRASEVLLLVAEDFYHSERLSRFQLIPDSLDQWAESTQQRLLGYQGQTQRLLSTSREEVVKQLSVFEQLLHSSPAVLISNHEQQHRAWLTDEVGGVREKLEEKMAASEKEKGVNVRQLRASLTDDELQMLNSREELRQQQLHRHICCTHLELQERLRVRGAEFMTTLTSLTKTLLHQLDATAETETAVRPEPLEDSAVTMQAVTIATASITSAKCILGNREVTELRDAAAERFDQLIRLELLRSDDDKRRQLSEQQSWNTHWRQQTHTRLEAHGST
ncbi:coiled-coil domain-containing protein 180 [Mugil cephalus]|uniref:coiled-coil domain-containing protein 180 n=1 Tax=Mugil cephalus TaxID=48193 RepID=UPI001FB72128|nr:coiled-coil domain-containing protein 180 [Mugil cephalus]